MNPVFSFFLYELRSHVKPVLAVWATWLLLPFLYRVEAGNWTFWTGDGFQDISAVLLLLTAPLLATLLCATRWAKERSDGTLEWLYARPLSSRAMFLARVGAIVVALAIFIGGVSSLVWFQSGSLGASLRYWGGWNTVAVVLAAVLAAGVAASALSRSWGQAAVLLFGSVMAVNLLVRLAQILTLQAEPWRGWEVLGDVQLLLPAPSWFIPLCLLAMGLAVAWAAVRHSPADPKVARRGLRTKLAPIALVLLVFSSLPLASLRQFHVEAARDLGERWRLELVRNEAMPLGDRLMRLVKGNERKLLEPAVKSPDLLRFADPDRGRAMLRTEDSWLVVSRDGTVQDLQFVDGTKVRAMLPVGWSPAGEHFAWVEYEVDPSDPSILRWEKLMEVTRPDDAAHLVLWDEADQGRRLVEVPSPLRLARWLDAEHLLLTESDREPGPWMVVRLDGTVERPSVGPADGREAWFPPASGSAALVPGASEDSWELAKLEPDTWELTTLTTVPRKAGPWLATLPDGRVTWLTLSKDTASTWLLDANLQAREVCRAPVVSGNFFARFRGVIEGEGEGERGGSALWELYTWAPAEPTAGPPRLGTVFRFLGCNLENGEPWEYRVDPLEESVHFDVTSEGLMIHSGVWVMPSPSTPSATARLGWQRW